MLGILDNSLNNICGYVWRWRAPYGLHVWFVSVEEQFVLSSTWCPGVWAEASWNWNNLFKGWEVRTRSWRWWAGHLVWCDERGWDARPASRPACTPLAAGRLWLDGSHQLCAHRLVLGEVWNYRSSRGLCQLTPPEGGDRAGTPGTVPCLLCHASGSMWSWSSGGCS